MRMDLVIANNNKRIRQMLIDMLDLKKRNPDAYNKTYRYNVSIIRKLIIDNEMIWNFGEAV